MSPEPIAYLERLRSYYQALGYDEAYRWARIADVPFVQLAKPPAAARLALVTTAAPFRPACGDQDVGAPYNAAAKFYRLYADDSGGDPDLRISHLTIDRDHWKSADRESYFPLKALRRAKARGLIGEITPRFFGFPTNRSQRVTIETDCTALREACLADRVDAALFIANCPVCHQSLALAANALEDAGIATVLMGSALDIVAHVGAPRFLFSDFPLGHSAGKPDDEASQDETLALALSLLATAGEARTIWRSPQHWSADDNWKNDYCNAARLTPAELARRRADFDEAKAVAADLRREAALTPPDASGWQAPRRQ